MFAPISLALDEELAFLPRDANLAQIRAGRINDYSIWETADSLLGSSLRAPRGHTAMQRMQEMHASPAARLGSPLSIAQTGHAAAHAPQETQSPVASGAMR